jgi:ABC-type phosphate/phosphonate transport system substrate-binding protein
MEPRYVFSILPLNHKEIDDAVQNSKIDFIVTNPGHYVSLEKKYHISRIATMIKLKNGQRLDRFGGVIFTLVNRTEIKELKDLKDKKIAAVNQNAFGGYAIQMYEFFKHNIFADDLEFHFTGMSLKSLINKS